MKKNILSLTALALLLSAVPQGFTQEAQAPAAGFRVERFVFELSLPQLALSQAQIEELIPIVRQLLERPFPTPSEAKRIQSIMDRILTPAQKEALTAADLSRQQGGAPGAGAPPGSMGRALAGRQRGSSDEQTQPLSAAQRKRRALERLLAQLEQAKEPPSR